MASAGLLRGRPLFHRIEGAEEGARNAGNTGQEVPQPRPGEGCRVMDQGTQEVASRSRKRLACWLWGRSQQARRLRLRGGAEHVRVETRKSAARGVCPEWGAAPCSRHRGGRAFLRREARAGDA